LRGADLTGAILDRANLFRSRLDEAIYDRDSLRQSCNWMLADFGPSPPGFMDLPDRLAERVNRLDFSQSNLDGMRFCYADLRRVNLDRATFHGGIADHADLRNVSANQFSAKRATFIASDMRNGSFVDADLADASLAESRLTGSTFRRASLHGTVFRAAILRDVRFVGASLIRADFLDADLTGASFRSADLDQADFTDAVLIETDLRGAFNMTCNQLVLGRDWELALRDETLACGAQIPNAD
jgi:uncharacterized protein YjbI with pentapeptide repeats